MLKYKKGRRNSGFAECVCGVFGCAGGDRQAREGSRRFDPIHFSLHVCINIYIERERCDLFPNAHPANRAEEAGSGY